MITYKEIEKYIKDDILQNIYEKRKEELCKIDENEEIGEVLENYPIDSKMFLLAVENLPPYFNNIRECILEAFEKYNMRENLINNYNYEKFYKTGFCDGIKILLECLRNKSSI